MVEDEKDEKEGRDEGWGNRGRGRVFWTTKGAS